MDQKVYASLKVWLDEHFDALVEDIKTLSAIPSVARYDDPDTPFGQGCRDALHAALKMAENYGFQTRNYDNLYGCITMRPAQEEISFWGHLDVVPAGDGWQLTEPFKPILKGDWLIGRGTDDNKGPLLGVMYLMRAFEELKIPTRHGLRMFMGCDEEHGMRDVEHYASHYPPQKLTIIPDCGFPVCYGEKGILEANIVSVEAVQSVLAFEAGMASNIVPDKAHMALRGEAADKCTGEWVNAVNANGNTDIHTTGLSRHSAFPEGGVNAIHEATAAALHSGLLSGADAQVFGFFNRVNDDYLGTALNIQASDDVSGNTTCVGTMASIRPDGKAVLHLNIRYCITADSDAMIVKMEKACGENGCVLELLRDSKPNYFPRENPVVDAMTNVFNEITGMHKESYVMGGGTYARKLQNAMGFGLGSLPREEPDFFAPGHGGAHQPDEGLYLPNLKKGLLIFAMGVLEADQVLT